MNHDVVILNQSGTIVYANEPLLQKAKFALAEVVERLPKEVWGGYMNPCVYKQVWNDVAQQKPTSAVFHNKSKTGEWYETDLHIATIVDSKSDEQYHIGIAPPKASSVFSETFFSLWSEQNERTQRWLRETLQVQPGKTVFDTVYTTWISPTQAKFEERYTDYALIQKAQENHDYFGDIYTKYRSQIYQYFRMRLGNNEPLAEELTQETFLRAFRYLDTFTQPHASYQTYLYRVAHSQLVSYIRKQKDLVSLSDVSEPYSLDESVQEQLNLEALLDTAATVLSSAEYRVCSAFYVDQESIRDISIAMGKSCNAVKLLLSRARKKLRHMLPPD